MSKEEFCLLIIGEPQCIEKQELFRILDRLLSAQKDARDIVIAGTDDIYRQYAVQRGFGFQGFKKAYDIGPDTDKRMVTFSGLFEKSGCVIVGDAKLPDRFPRPARRIAIED